MNLRLATLAPFPWLNIITGIIFGKRRRRGLKSPSAPKRPRRFFKLPRSLSVTREGKWFIGVLLVIGVAAINTGNNLLYLVVATMLSFIVISGIMSEETLKALKIERRLPKHVFKSSPAQIRLSITNNKRFLPSFSFTVAELPANGLKSEDAYVLKLKEKNSAIRNPFYTFERRGRVVLSGAKIATRFPFGLFLKGREEYSEDEVIVYPSITAPVSRRLAEIARSEGVSSTRKKGEGAELYNLRQYAEGDDARHIYWKSAGRTERLLLKEFERESEKKVIIAFDNFDTPDPGDFELIVDEAASVVNHFIVRGFSVGLKTLGAEVRPKPGMAQLYAALNVLALTSPVKVPGKCAVRVVNL